MFRTLKADEIECRSQQVLVNGTILLLYKDARVDMNILDETVGAMNWQRGHSRENANCIVSIWDKDKSQWISKEDTGIESNTQKEKGLASDSFKRACTNWGIGRELYTSPFIWIALENGEAEKDGVKYKLKKGLEFRVSKIEYDLNKNIINLEIVDNKNKLRYSQTQKKAPIANLNSDKSINTPPTKQDTVKNDLTPLQVKLFAEVKKYNLTNEEVKEILGNAGFTSSKEVKEENMESLLLDIKEYSELKGEC